MAMLRAILGLLALASLLACLVLPVMYFRGSLDNQHYKDLFVVVSAAWFVFAIWWAAAGKRRAS
jgi:hypothetical protein